MTAMGGAMDAAELRVWLCRRVATLAGVAEADLDPSEPFSAYGLDSVGLGSLATELRERLDRQVDVTVMFEYPTVNDLVRYLTEGADRQPARLPERQPPTPGQAPEPAAIIGIACHVPGADSLDEFWSLVRDGASAIGTVPAGRWDIDLSTAVLSDRERAIRFGGFLPHIDRFDANFFRVSREEAIRMDPQQRLLLQTTWEALEDAGLRPSQLRGSRTGVFVGISDNEYGRRQLVNLDDVSALTPTGNALSTAANRISYLFDFRGPSLAVDTACSSSLVATHLAVRSLRSAEITTAVVAGANLLLEPEISLALARAGILSRDGTCRSFDAAADGYVRAEGCLVVIIKPLAAAQADGDRIYAIIRGSAVNQDGLSNGLTAPNPRAQTGVLADAYQDAQISPALVGYLECHGSGTQLGDPIEARALGEVMGPGRDEALTIGSIKANIGHLEAAAGIAGIARAALALHHRTLPPIARFAEPNPNIAFDHLKLTVRAAPSPWPLPRRIAGVSSFGFGGTNAHVVLEAVSQPEPAADAGQPLVVTVSGRDEEAATIRARELARFVLSSDLPLADIAATTTGRRDHHDFRIAAHGRTREHIAARLEERADSGPIRSRETAQVAFVFGGQGYLSTHAAPLALDPDRRFRAMLRRCDEIVRDLAGWSIAKVLSAADPRELERTELAQPIHVALQLALAARWEGAGIRPSAVVGHSIGEIAAAYVAGALSLEQALRVGIARGLAVAPTIGTGRMLIVGCGEQETAGIIDALGVKAEISAVNSAQSTTVSGPTADLELIQADCEQAGRFVARVPVEYPSHSSAMDDAALALTSMLADLDAAPPDLPMVSSVAGAPLDAAPDAAYWGSNLRQRVRFADAVTAILATSAALIEVSPQPLLRSPLRRLAADAGVPDLPVLESAEPPATLDELRAAAQAALYELGLPVKLEESARRRAPVTVPAYPWRRDRYWYDRPAARQLIRPQARLLGQRIDLVGDDRQWQLDFCASGNPELLDHRLHGLPVLPAAGFVEVMLECAQAIGLRAPVELRDVTFLAPLPLEEHRSIQTVLRPSGTGFAIEVHSRPAASAQAWTLHAKALLIGPSPDLTRRGPGQPGGRDVTAWYSRCIDPWPTAEFYAFLKSSGLEYGPAFQRVSDIWCADGEAIAMVRGGETGRFLCHPAALDGAFQVAAAAVGPGVVGATPVPVRIGSLTWHGGWAGGAHVLASAPSSDAGQLIVADLQVVGPDRAALVDVAGFEVKLAGQAAAIPPPSRLRRYEVVWREQPGPDSPRPESGRWLVIGDGPIAMAVSAAAPDGVTVVRESTAPRDRAEARAILSASNAASASWNPTDVLLAFGGADAADGRADASDGRDDAASAAEVASATLATAAALTMSAGQAIPRLWIVTDRAQPSAAAAWGLARVFCFEHPELEIRCAGLGELADAVEFAAEVSAPTDESEIAWRHGRRYVRRLEHARPRPESNPDNLVTRPGAAYLVTGGLGGLGLAAARRLVEDGAGQVILMSRNASADAAAEAVQIGTGGCDVTIVTGDVADPDDLARALAAVEAHRCLSGVIHAAGVLADGPLHQLDRASFDRVAHAKVAGLARLLSALPVASLDWLVVFSSVAAVVGSPGQGAYCAAGAAMDALAESARLRGLPLVTINWGPWAKVGLAARTSSSQRWRAGTSAAAIEPDEGIDLLEQLIRERSSGIVVPFDFADLVRYFPRRLGSPFFADTAAADEVLAASLAPPQIRTRPASGTEYIQPRNELEQIIAAIWVRSLGFDRVSVTDGFFELGGDSVLANQVVIEVGRALGIVIEPEKAFANLTIAGLAELAESAMIGLVDAMSEEEAQVRLSQLRPDSPG